MGREDDIRQMAYCIWEGQNYCNGHEIEHWLKAEAMWEESHRKKPVSKETKSKPNPIIKIK